MTDRGDRREALKSVFHTARNALFTLCATCALVTPGAAPVHAELRKGVQPIIDQWLAATGGREARDMERRVHMKGRLDAVALHGTWEMWLAAPDRWAMQVKLGSLNIREGYDGRTAWRTDLSARRVRVLEGVELEQAQEDAFFLHERWTEPDQGGAFIRKGSLVLGRESSAQVIEVTPPVGHPRRFFVNAKNGFIERVESERDHQTSVERWLDYHKVAGRKRNMKVAWGLPRWGEKDPEQLEIDSVLVNVPFDEEVFSPPELRERKITWLGAQGATTVPFKYGSRHVWVRVSVNGRPPADFILDTGASLTAFDKDWAFDNGIEPEGQSTVEGMAGTDDMAFARVGSLTLVGGKNRGVRLKDFRAGLVDLGESFEMSLWRKPAGLLGSDFLSRFVLEIDYDSSRVTLHDPETWTPPVDVEPVPMQLFGGIPTVELTLGEGCGGRFLVDVGNSSGLDVHGSAVRRCGLFHGLRRPRVESYGGGIGGGFNVTLCRMDSVQLGPWRWAGPIVGLSLHNQGAVGSNDLAGNIGNGILEKFRCAFDYKHGNLWLEPGARFAEPERLSRLGAFLARGKQWVVVASIVRDSPADDGGLKVYDEVLTIDGRDVLKWTREEIDRVLYDGQTGSVHTFRVRRFDYEEHTVEVTLRDVL